MQRTVQGQQRGTLRGRIEPMPVVVYDHKLIILRTRDLLLKSKTVRMRRKCQAVQSFVVRRLRASHGIGNADPVLFIQHTQLLTHAHVPPIHIVLDGNTLHIVLDMNIGATLINQEYFSCFDGSSRQFITDVFPDPF